MSPNTVPEEQAVIEAAANDRKAVFVKDGVVIGILLTTEHFSTVLTTNDNCVILDVAHEVLPDWSYIDGTFLPPTV